MDAGAVIVCVCQDDDTVLLGRYSGLVTAFGSDRPARAPRNTPRTIPKTNGQILEKMNQIAGPPPLTLPPGLVAGSDVRTLEQKRTIRRHFLTQLHARMPDNPQRIHIVHFLNDNDNDFHLRTLYHAGHPLGIMMPQGTRDGGETVVRCAAREFGEEVGIEFDEGRFTNIGTAGDYRVFRLCIDDAEKALIINNYNNGSTVVRREGAIGTAIPAITPAANTVDSFKYGSELFNVNFIPIANLENPTPPETVRPLFRVDRDPGSGPGQMPLEWGCRTGNQLFRQIEPYNCPAAPPAPSSAPPAPANTPAPGGGAGGPDPPATATIAVPYRPGMFGTRIGTTRGFPESGTGSSSGSFPGYGRGSGPFPGYGPSSGSSAFPGYRRGGKRTMKKRNRTNKRKAKRRSTRRRSNRR
jgi:8-oxo-dGTP pyrophosphatase MutT (NUDIX family)